MYVCELELRATPMRGDKFEEIWKPAASRVMDYGAKGYTFIREEDDLLHFIHLSYWQEKIDFERYWHSEEMQKIRQKASGIYQVPVLPHWFRLVDGPIDD